MCNNKFGYWKMFQIASNQISGKFFIGRNRILPDISVNMLFIKVSTNDIGKWNLGRAVTSRYSAMIFSLIKGTIILTKYFLIMSLGMKGRFNIPEIKTLVSITAK